MSFNFIQCFLQSKIITEFNFISFVVGFQDRTAKNFQTFSFIDITSIALATLLKDNIPVYRIVLHNTRIFNDRHPLYCSTLYHILQFCPILSLSYTIIAVSSCVVFIADVMGTFEIGSLFVGVIVVPRSLRGIILDQEFKVQSLFLKVFLLPTADEQADGYPVIVATVAYGSL